MLYARVSPKGSTWNAEETSIALQVQQMKDYVLRKDPQAKFIVREDEFKSGKNLQRTGIQSILEELENGTQEWHTLVVWALDRLSRSLVDAVPIFEMLRDAGCGFICIRQEYLSTEGAMARFTLNQTILIAQLEREMTSERVKEKMVWIARKGKIPSGRIPVGYRRRIGVKNEIEPDPETVPIVQDIFHSYLAQNETIADLKRRYPKYLTAKMQLYRMLRNRIYIGEVEYDGNVYPGQHEPIIDRATFDAVNEMLPGERQAPRPSRQVYKYLLPGLVYCHCGRKMTPYSVKKGGKNSDIRYFYYKCQDTLNCKYSINAERLDAEVLQAVRDIARDESYLKEQHDGWFAEQTTKNDIHKKQLQELNDKISNAMVELSQINNLFVSGVVKPENADYWNERLSDVRQNLLSLETQKKEFTDSLQHKSGNADFPTLLHEMQHWASLIDVADSENDYFTKRNILLSIVHRVNCTDQDGTVEVEVLTKGNKWRAEWGLIVTKILNIQKWKTIHTRAHKRQFSA